MASSRTEEEPYGRHVLRLRKAPEGWEGIVVGRAAERREGPSREAVIGLLRRLIDEDHPRFIGFEGAIRKFRLIFDQGAFEDPYYVQGRERNFKLDARAVLNDLPPERAARETSRETAATAERAFAEIKFQLIAWQEVDRARTLLRSLDGPAFVAAAARFCLEPGPLALGTLRAIAGRHDAAAWTVVTYLPWLWRPDEHMFLKPNATCRFAERVGHPFQHADLSGEPYTSYDMLRDLALAIRRETADLGCRDNIDAQGFVWVTEVYDVERDARPEGWTPLLS